MPDFKLLAQTHHDYVVKMRRAFHQHPELSQQEEWTSATICAELAAMGLPYHVLEDRGVVATLDTGRPGKRIAVRADIDALPVTELTDVPFKSQNPGVMHACGHDAHAANLLGVAKCLLDAKAELSGTYYLCFQIGEEHAVGAEEIVAYLKSIGGVDACCGIHVFAAYDESVMLPSGAFLAGILPFEINVTGKGGHGSMPHNSINPLMPASEILLRIASIPTNRLNALDSTVISPCTIHAGTAMNIIPDTATITGTVRFFNKDKEADIFALLERVSRCVAESYGAAATVKRTFNTLLPVVNNAACAAAGQQIAREMGVPLMADVKVMGSDNFSSFTDAFPGFYASYGVGNKAKGICVEQHNARFDMDEDALAGACEFLTRSAVALSCL